MTAQQQQPSDETLARSYARTAAEAYTDHANYLWALPADAWGGSTGATEWTVRDLAGHVVGEAVWFPNLTRSVTRGEAPLPDSLYQSLKDLPPQELAGRLAEAARDIQVAVDAATNDQLRQPVDVGFTKMPLWQATYLPLSEAVYHTWDLKVGRDPTATIPTPWARQVATRMVEFAPMIANQEGAAEAPGRYLLQVGNGIGPVTVIAREGDVTLERGATGTPDVTLRVTADQYVRLMAGRLNLAHAIERSDVTVEGDRARALGLTRIFQGIKP